MKEIGAVTIGNLIKAHYEKDEHKFKSYAEFIAEAYKEKGEERAERIIRSKIDGSYKNKPVAVILDKEIKEELKDEMKNRISLALKDPILQQGFEVICKENAELKDYRLTTLAKQQTENQKYTVNLEHKLSWYDDQLTKAKEIIKELYEGLDKLYLSGLSDKQIAFIERLQDKTEQYFKGDMVCLRKKQKNTGYSKHYGVRRNVEI